MNKLLLFILAPFFFISCHRPALKTGLEGKKIPAFNILSLDSSSSFSTSDIRNGEPAVLFYFSPRCPYCRAQMSDMIDNIEVLKGIQIYMMTSFPLSETRQFCSDYHLNRYANIKIGSDYKFFFANYFKAGGVPYTAVYGRDRKLRGAYIGPVKSKDILAIAND